MRYNTNTKVTWEELIAKTEDEQVNLINLLLRETKPKRLSDLEKDYFGVNVGTISKHFSSLGYRYLTKQYVKKSKESNYSSASESYLYNLVNEVASSSKGFKGVNLKVSTEALTALNEFLDKNQALKKQDVLSAAILDFTRRFSD